MPLDGLTFIVMMHAPGAMGAGNITVGLIIDERASDAQVEAISAIATGAAGGPMAALGPLVGKIAGVERRPIQFDVEGLNRAVRAGDLVDQACEGIPSAGAPGQAIGVDNTAHPVNSRLSLAKATAQPVQRLRHQVERFDRHAQRPLRTLRLGRLNYSARQRACISGHRRHSRLRFSLAGATVPQRHPPGSIRRVGAVQRRRTGAAQA